MKITKYSHACFVVENEGQSIIVDPGKWSDDFVVPANAVAVFVSHEHEDHIDEKLLRTIVDKNPGAVVLAHANVIAKLKDFKTQPVKTGDTVQIESFELEFFGGQHATIAPDIPIIANLGVLINSTLFYGGDSFAVPNKSVQTIALPVSAPWMKYSEALEFLQAVKPARVFPTHDAILSDAGKDLADRMVGASAEKIGARYERLPIARSVDI